MSHVEAPVPVEPVVEEVPRFTGNPRLKELVEEVARLGGLYSSHASVYLPSFLVKKIAEAKEFNLRWDDGSIIIEADGEKYRINPGEGEEVNYDTCDPETCEEEREEVERAVDDALREAVEETKKFLRGEDDCAVGVVVNENPDGYYYTMLGICKE